MSINLCFLLILWCVPLQTYSTNGITVVAILSQEVRIVIGPTNCDILASGFLNAAAWAKSELLHIETIVFPLDCRFYLSWEKLFTYSFRF